MHAYLAVDISKAIAQSCGSKEDFALLDKMAEFNERIATDRFGLNVASDLKRDSQKHANVWMSQPGDKNVILVVLSRTMVIDGAKDGAIWGDVFKAMPGSVNDFLRDKNNRSHKEICRINSVVTRSQHQSVVAMENEYNKRVHVGSTPTMAQSASAGTKQNSKATSAYSGELAQAYAYVLSATDCYNARKEFEHQILTSGDLNQAKQLARQTEDEFVSRSGQAKADDVWNKLNSLYNRSSQESGIEFPKLFYVDTTEIDIYGNAQATAIASQMGNPLTLNGNTMVARGGATWPSLFGNRNYEGYESICTFVKSNVAQRMNSKRSEQTTERNF